MNNQVQDIDSQETQEWVESLESVIEIEGVKRAHYLLEKLIDTARLNGANLPYSANTAYINTIPPHMEEHTPGNRTIESRLRSYIRWNAAAMVVRANRENPELGGHIATFASAATLYDIGMNHFWRAPSPQHGGDLVYVQGHAAPGMYARSFMEGRFTEEELDNFRQEVDGGGLSSYPHPWLMPDYWQFPTVSMGLGPIKSIYQARFMKYLQDRKLADTSNRKVWAFVGDGESDEPETLGAISLGGREKLDNLVWVVNCNLQRLDGPVRGNGKIVQELEAVFRGAGWNVIKVLWGSYWDPLLAKDKDGLLKARMMEAVDGEYQNYKAKDGAFVREHFFGKYPELKEMVATMSDADIWRLNRGGHDPHKVYAAYHAAVHHTGQPTVILAHTVKGYGMGSAGEGQNRTHSQKKLTGEEMIAYKNRFNIPLSDEDAAAAKYFRPDPDSEEIKYLLERRKALGGFLPHRQTHAAPLKVPDLSIFQTLLESTGEREMSTTMVFVRLLTLLARDKGMGKHVVPIVPDEARTFGMEGMFRQMGIHSSVGQLYEPQDKDQVMFYKEDKSGQILEEGITEAGAMSSWIAAATAYSAHGVNMVPFYIYYSMFGFQRIGDLIWLAADARCKGFLLGATAGRTTLNGEGLQHQDGHSHVLAYPVPTLMCYDPAYAYELAVIIKDGIKRMYEDKESLFYYLSVYNENYAQPPMPQGAEEGILKGMYRLRPSDLNKEKPVAQLLGSGPLLNESVKAQEILEHKYGVASEVWSVTSYKELRREAKEIERKRLLHADQKIADPYVTQCLGKEPGVVVATSDYLKLLPDSVSRWIQKPLVSLGTDGFGRSDTRKRLRDFFEVDHRFVVVGALAELVRQGKVKPDVYKQALKDLEVDVNKLNPMIS